jgi:hypothetical protein
MSARFFVIGSFLVRSRNLFVAVGDVTDGKILPGMRIVVDLGNLKLDAGTVAGIEVIEIALKGQKYVGLAFAFEEPADLEFLQTLDLSGQTLDVTS